MNSSASRTLLLHVSSRMCTPSPIEGRSFLCKEKARGSKNQRGKKKKKKQ
jgi:hypothetical protein